MKKQMAIILAFVLLLFCASAAAEPEPTEVFFDEEFEPDELTGTYCSLTDLGISVYIPEGFSETDISDLLPGVIAHGFTSEDYGFSVTVHTDTVEDVKDIAGMIDYLSAADGYWADYYIFNGIHCVLYTLDIIDGDITSKGVGVWIPSDGETWINLDVSPLTDEDEEDLATMVIDSVRPVQ